jgi:hypothetical protein
MSQDPKLGLYETDNDDTANVFWKYSQHIIQEYQNQLKINLPIPPSEGDGENEVNQPVKRVAVIGGGVSGLRVAMKLGAKYKVDLFEASDHVGGRLYTHKFENGGEWDYFVSVQNPLSVLILKLLFFRTLALCGFRVPPS